MKICPNCFSSRTFQQNTCVSCGYSREPREPRALPDGTILHRRYLVGRILGAGGFGITYVVYDRMKRKRMAVKEYFPSEWAMRNGKGTQLRPNSQSKDALYRHGQEVFVNEARVLCELREVPNIVNVWDFFAENGTAYMVMDMVDGYTLNKYMKKNNIRQMPWREVSRIIREIGMSLTKVHEKMLLHRDVGPDNIMITDDGEVKLIDFGATRMYALNSEQSMSVLIKPGFAPLEQYSRNGMQGPWTDVYALAATCYYLLSGKKPPDATLRPQGTMVTPVIMHNMNVPERVNRAIEHAMELNWSKRTQNMSEFLREMGLLQKPGVQMVVGNQTEHFDFKKDNILTIGRNSEVSDIILNNIQVSGLHCQIFYDSENDRFRVQNYSGNRTYTYQKVLNKNDWTILQRGDWLYIETKSARYIFYLEVE